MPIVQPNSAGCNCFDSVDTDRPPDTLQGDVLDQALSSADLDTVSTDDDNYHTSNTQDQYQSPGQRIKFDLGTGDVTDADVTVRGYGVGSDGEGWYFYVWDNSSSQWVFLASHTHYDKQTLSANDLQGYVYASGGHRLLQLRVCGRDHEYGGSSYLYYAQCEYVAAPVAQATPADLVHGHSLDASGASQTHVSTPDNGVHGHLLEATSGSQAHVASLADLASGHVLESTAGAITITATPDGLSQGHLLDPVPGSQAHIAGPSNLLAGHTLEGPTISQAHAAGPTDLSHGHFLSSPTGAILLGAPASLAHGLTLADAQGTQAHVATPAGIGHGHGLRSTAGTVTYIAGPVRLSHAHVLEEPAVAQQHVATPVGLAHAQSLGTTLGFLHVHLYVSVPEDGQRRLSWEEPGTVHLVIDGELEAEITDGQIELDAQRQVRGILIGYLHSMPEHLPTPLDEVLLSITGDPVLHHIERQPDGGDWERIASVLPSQEATYRDGPLDDGLWHYRAVAQDEEGDTATSDVESVTVSSMPDPPSGLDWTWDADTETLTLTWQASPSPDVASHRVRQGEDLLSWNAEPAQDSSDLEYVPGIEAGTTGVLIFSVRAVDADGNEEQNVTQVLAIPFEDGAPAARPAEPRWVEARAIEDGRIELEWLYDPRYEDYGPGAAPGAQGAAAEARIYWDAGTGEIDFSEPHATVEMAHPTEAARYAWQSQPLTDGQTYRFTIRIATAPRPAGLETQNTDSHPATADATSPSAPDLSTVLV